MGVPGKIAFPVILALGAITGYLTYNWFTEATPDEGTVISPYRKELPPKTEENKPADNTPVDESTFAKVITINILQGSATQGSPDYDPDAAKTSIDALITWVNTDTNLHSATSGTGVDDADKGKLFDTGILAPGKEYSKPAAEIGKGEHTYFCIVHPFMTATITIE